MPSRPLSSARRRRASRRSLTNDQRLRAIARHDATNGELPTFPDSRVYMETYEDVALPVAERLP